MPVQVGETPPGLSDEFLGLPGVFIEMVYDMFDGLFPIYRPEFQLEST